MHSTHALEAATPATTVDDGPTRSWGLLAIALAAQILVVLDISVVNTALPSIGRALSLRDNQLQWLVTAYLMMSGGGLLLGGRIADLYSRRRVFLTGLALFTVASFVSGFAQTGTELIAARAVQGLSAALLTPAALSLISNQYSGGQRQTALALWGVVGSLGIAMGVLLGGAITSWLGWQFIFWINVPIGASAVVIGVKVIDQDHGSRPSIRDLDIAGAVAVIGGLAAFMYALEGTATHGWWSLHTEVPFVAAGLLLAVFLRIERRADKPLVPPHVWRLKSLVVGTTVMLGATGILVGAIFLTSIYLQTVLGFSALRTGLAFLPFALAVTAGAVVAKHLLSVIAPRNIAVAGLVVTAASALLLSYIPNDASYLVNVLPGLFLVGLGVGMVFVPVSVTAMAGIPESHAGTASGFLMTGHEIGAALGVAVLSAVASTAGSLATTIGATAAFSRGFVAAAVVAVVVAAGAAVRMSSTKAADGAGHMHMHH